MNKWDTQWLAVLPDWPSGPWAPVLTLVATLLAMMLLAFVWRRPLPQRQKSGDSHHHDRYASTAPISEEQVAILRYLHTAFPDGAVLFRPCLSRFVVVRACRDITRTREQLARGHVDFLICSEDGEPVFAFAIDAFRDQDDTQAAQEAAELNRVLRSAGIRLIRLKGAQALWPPPEVLRMRLLAVRRPPMPAEAAARPSTPSTSTPSVLPDFASSGPATRPFAPDSDVMGLSTLMALTPARADDADDPWACVRKR